VRFLKIVTYDEVDPEQVSLLYLICFATHMSPEDVELLRRFDKRTSDYYGIYALDDSGCPVSQVLVLHIETKTRDGIEKVAGIAAVGTLPGHARRGLSTALMKRAHELTRDRGMRISILLTSASLVAYDMYTKLGYSTIAAFDRGIKRVTTIKTRKGHALQLGRFKLNDAEPLDKAFALQTEGSLGFVCRQPKFLVMKVKTHQASPERIKVASIGRRIVGYARVDSSEDYAEIQELVAINQSTRLDILGAIERQPKAKWLVCSGLCDRRLSSLYASQGFRIYEPGWGRVMATSVDGSLSSGEIAELYGVNEGRFVINALDTF
jgi:GNAT superfamily N-acetyltransferase